MEKFEDLVSESGQSRNALLKMIDTSCRAYLLGERCAGCGKPAELKYRGDYAPATGQWASAEFRRHHGRCEPCGAEALAAKARIAAVEAEQQAKRLIELLAPAEAQLPAVDYLRLTYYDSFVFYSVLAAANNSWQGNLLRALKSQHGKLAPTDQLSEQLYAYLHRIGILHPSSQSHPSAFQFDCDNNIAAFSIPNVDWVIAKDLRGESITEIFGSFGERLVSWPEADSVTDLWYMVAASECERYFIQQCQRYKFFKDDIYTEKVSETITEYLGVLSIGQMLHIIFYALKDLAALSQEKKYARQHVYNMIPGTIRRLADYKISNNKEITPWSRRFSTVEPWILSILLDKIMGNGNEAYRTLTGSSVRDQIPKDDRPEWLRDGS